jgi:hypothetical protein
MKRIIIIIVALVLLVAVYVLSYRTSHLVQLHPDDNTSFKLVIAGIPFPSNSTTISIFSTIYRPLIDLSARQMPTKDVEGSIRKIDLLSGELMLAREGQDGILIQIPDTMKDQIRHFSAGDLIRASYGFRPMNESPFCHSFELRTINHIAQK